MSGEQRYKQAHSVALSIENGRLETSPAKIQMENFAAAAAAELRERALAKQRAAELTHMQSQQHAKWKLSHQATREKRDAEKEMLVQAETPAMDYIGVLPEVDRDSELYLRYLRVKRQTATEVSTHL